MMEKVLVVGITGTNGAGKGTIVEILKKNGFAHLSVGDYLLEEVKKIGWEECRESQIKMGNELRAKYGPGYIAEQLYEKAKIRGGKVIIESIRTIGEIETLKSKGPFILLGVTAPRELRYQRILDRGGFKDTVSFEEFSRSEDMEMSSTDPNKQNLSRCIELADYQIENEGTIEELQIKVKNIINNF